MGHAPSAFIDRLVQQCCEAAVEARTTAVPTRAYHAMTAPVTGLSVNRRQRCGTSDEDGGSGNSGESGGQSGGSNEHSSKEDTGAGDSAGSSSSSSSSSSGDGSGNSAPIPKPRWFEVAGQTTLGRRPDGPVLPMGDVIAFVTDTDDADTNADADTVVATLLSFAMHPTCVGIDGLLQSSDYIGSARDTVESSVGGTSLFVNGACGDINPWNHRVGYDGATKAGARLGDAFVKALARSAPLGSRSGKSGVCSVRSEARELRLPLEPLPDEDEARRFHEQQVEWLEAERGEDRGGDGEGGNSRSSSGGDDSSGGGGGSRLLPAASACCAYAANVLAAATTAAAGADALPFSIHALQIGPVCLLGFEGEMFAEYQMNIVRVTACYCDSFNPLISNLHIARGISILK